jgi:hypothetical protein
MALPLKYAPNVISPQVFGGYVYGDPIQWWEGPENYASWAATQLGANSLAIQPVIFPERVGAASMDIFVSGNYSATNNASSRGDTISVSVGLYSYTASSLSLAASVSQTYAFTVTGSSSSASYHSLKAMSLPFFGNVPAGNYWMALISNTSTAGNAIAASFSNVVVSYAGNLSAYAGRFGGNTAASNSPILGYGFQSVTTTALPSAIALSDISGSGLGNTNRWLVNVKNYSA